MHQDGFNSIQIMISKIISRAACLTELTSNSKSFSNCPDLHGGVPGLPGDRIYMKPAVDKGKVVPLAAAPVVICEQNGDPQRAQDSGRL
jgi:hypothetical protein